MPRSDRRQPRNAPDAPNSEKLPAESTQSPTIEIQVVERSPKRQLPAVSEYDREVMRRILGLKRLRGVTSSRIDDTSHTNSQPNSLPNSQGDKQATTKHTVTVAQKHTPHLRNPNSKIVIFEVGPGRDLFHVHDNYVNFYSPFLRKALEDSEQEDCSFKINCRDVEAPIFGLFVHWLYHQRIQHPGQTTPSVLDVTQLWVAAAKFQVPLLQNRAITLLTNIISEEKVTADAPSNSDIETFCSIAYTGKNRPVLGKLAIDRLVRFARTQDMQNKIHSWFDFLPREIQTDYSIALTKHCSSIPMKDRMVTFNPEDYFVKLE